jgi:hypothetical protein
MADKTLQDQVKERLAKQGAISERDLAAFTPADAPKAEEKKDFIAENTETPVGDLAQKNPIMNAAAGPTGQALIMDLDETTPDKKPVVLITKEEKDAFIEALVTGRRYKTSFTLCGGKVTGTLQSRTQLESQAILAELRHELDSGKLHTQADYTMRLQRMLLAAQAVYYMDKTYEALAEPLLPTWKPDGTCVEPGWLKQVEVWEKMPEAAISIAFAELQRFEAKYWTMVEAAADSNFWNPAVST